MLFRFIAFIFLCTMLFGLDSRAADAAHADDGDAYLSGARIQIAVLADPQGVETITSVSDPARADEFRAMPYGFSAGYTHAVHWLRFTLRAGGEGGEGGAAAAKPAATAPSRPPATLLEVQPSYLDDLRLYIPQPGRPGVFEERLAGDHLPFTAREYPYRAFVFALQLPDMQPRTFYLRLATTSSSLVILRQWSPVAFQAALLSEYTVIGLYYGVMLMVLIVVLWQGLWRTVPVFRAYLLYLVCSLLSLLAVNGLVSQFILPGAPLLANWWASLSTLLLASTGPYFYRLILDIDRRQTWLYWIYRVITWTCLALLPAPFFDVYQEAASLALSLLMVTLLLGLGRSLLLWRRRAPGSALLILGHVGGIVGALSVSLSLLGILPGNFWMANGFQFGSMATLIPLGLLLVQRVRAMERQRVLAVERAERAETDSERERRARRDQSQFVAMLSHEIKTPLAMIDGATQSLIHLAGDGGVSGDSGVSGASGDTTAAPANAVSQRHDRIRRGVRRINHLVDQFLQQDRLDDEQLSLRPAPVDGRQLGARAVAARDSQRLSPVTATGDCRLLADPTLLEIALANLLDNALKYAPPGSPVELSVVGDAGQVCFAVADRGQGIAADLLPSLFERYVRGSGAGDIPGAGLGLYLVRRIAELHGGAIRYRPSAGGSRFELCLPKTPPAAPATARPTESPA